MEVYFGGDELPPAEEVSYFNADALFERFEIRQEQKESIARWNLPFV